MIVDGIEREVRRECRERGIPYRKPKSATHCRKCGARLGSHRVESDYCSRECFLEMPR
jgi:hypothetical protein